MSDISQNQEIKEAAIEAFLGWQSGSDVTIYMNRLKDALVRFGVDIDTRTKIYQDQIRINEISKLVKSDIANLIFDENLIIRQGEVAIGKTSRATTNEIRNILFSELGLNNVMKQDKKLLVLMAIDSSGSMGQYEKYIARSLQFWLEGILKRKFTNLEFRYLSHNIEAKEVGKEEFYSKGGSGGTICSSAYEKMLEIIYKYTKDYKVLTVHISDGDNLTSDNKKSKQLVEEILDVTDLHVYLEVNQYDRNSALKNGVYTEAKNKQIVSVIGEKNELIDTLKDVVKHI